MTDITEEQLRKFDKSIYESGWFESYKRFLERLQEFIDIVYRSSGETANE